MVLQNDWLHAAAKNPRSSGCIMLQIGTKANS
jgi:hypothetical protein